MNMTLEVKCAVTAALVLAMIAPAWGQYPHPDDPLVRCDKVCQDRLWTVSVDVCRTRTRNNPTFKEPTFDATIDPTGKVFMRGSARARAEFTECVSAMHSHPNLIFAPPMPTVPE